MLLFLCRPVCFSMSSSNCCLLICIYISQEAGQVVRHSHFFQNYPQYIVIHTVKGFGTVKKAETDVFLLLSCLFNDPVDVGSLISGSSAFSKTSLNIWKFMVHILLRPGLENFKPTISLSSFTFIKRLFSSSSFSAIRVVSSAYLRLLIFLLAILI